MGMGTLLVFWFQCYIETIFPSLAIWTPAMMDVASIRSIPMFTVFTLHFRNLLPWKVGGWPCRFSD